MRRTPHRFGLLGLAFAATMLGVACRSAEIPPPSTNTATATQTAVSPSAQSVTPAASPEQEVERAYLAYWDAYAAAVLNLDATLVEGFAADEELLRVRGEVKTLETDHVALRVVVEHDLLVVLTSATEASVVDHVVNRSFFVDAVTKQPPTASGGGELLKNTFFLRKVSGRWVVTRGVRDR